MTASKSRAKSALRADMRAIRRSLPDQDARAASIWLQVEQLPSVVASQTVMVYRSVPGEPETTTFIQWCVANGKTVVLPENDPVTTPALVDCVIVPGLAFTLAGDRLGQGGGWYDRYLAGLRPEAITIGVAFAPQIVDSLPVEPHDIRLDKVITD